MPHNLQLIIVKDQKPRQALTCLSQSSQGLSLLVQVQQGLRNQLRGNFDRFVCMLNIVGVRKVSNPPESSKDLPCK